MLLFLNILGILIINYLVNKTHNIKKIINNNNQNESNKSQSSNCNKKKTNWTSDAIIPLDKYNPNDCTNDSTCIISPNNKNLFPKTGRNTISKENSCDNKNLHDRNNLDKLKQCKLCNTIINMNNNIVTEKFTTYDPYRPDCDYTYPSELENNKNLSKILKKISKNLENNKSHSNISLEDLKKISKDLCVHCKTGVCVNDTCYSL